MALNKDRVNLSQWIDYRIFVISAYHDDELAETLPTAISSQAKLKGSAETENYTFFRYAIDDYVKTFTIDRSIDSTPISMTMDLFPDLVDTSKPESDFKFFYKLKNRFLTVFRPWDYIEIQVAELSISDTSLNQRQKEIHDFGALLANKKRSSDYSNSDINKFYKVRFRGFITNIEEQDTVDGGRVINIQAKSLLYFLNQTPFISNLAIFTDRAVETQRAHLLENQFIVLYGDLLTDLRDTTTRANALLEETFQIKSTSSNVQRINKEVGGKINTFEDKDLLGLVENPKANFNSLSNRLDISSIQKATGTQALLIPLMELFLSRSENSIDNNINVFYKVFKSDLFNQEIQFGGSNTEYISQFVNLLPTLKSWTDTIKYLVYEQANGTVVLDRQHFNNPIDIVIEPFRWKTYAFKETETGYITEYFVTPGTAFQVFDDSIRDTFFQTSGYTLDQLRRYGYRRPAPETNPNISSPKALEQYAKASKSINNAQLKTLDFTIPYDKRLDVGKIVWFQEKNLVGYIVNLTESVTYGGECSMSVSVQYLRDVLSVTKLNKLLLPGTTQKAKVVNATPTVTVETQAPTFDAIDTINNFIESIRKNGAIKNQTQDQIETTIRTFLLNNVNIDIFPEFTFISDFYSGNMQSVLQTPIVDKQERSIS